MTNHTDPHITKTHIYRFDDEREAEGFWNAISDQGTHAGGTIIANELEYLRPRGFEVRVTVAKTGE